jgi:preprotein translocase subunit SecA
MGVQESEVISHAMITRSIENAQKKMEEGVVTERKALSAQEWLQLNASSLNRTT